jgi:hypothetical protein
MENVANVPAKTTVEPFPPALQRKLDEHKDRILRLVKQTVENMMEIGKRLVEARTLCDKKGQWGVWLEQVGWKESVAQKYMNVSKAFAAVYQDGFNEAQMPKLEVTGLREAYFIARKVLAQPDLEKKQEAIKKVIAGKKVQETVKTASRERRKAERKSGVVTSTTGKVTQPDLATELGNLDRSVKVFEDLRDTYADLSVTNRNAAVEGLTDISRRIAEVIKFVRVPKVTIDVKANKPAAKKPVEKKPEEKPVEEKKPEPATA